jgi:hypothetical protein
LSSSIIPVIRVSAGSLDLAVLSVLLRELRSLA